MYNFLKCLLKNLVVLLCLQFSSVLKAQNWKTLAADMSVNFYDVCKVAEQHFDTIDIHAKGSGFKGYQRWIVDNEYKYYPEGERSNVDPYFLKHQYERFLLTSPKLPLTQLPTGAMPSVSSSGWSELGPISPGQITGHYSFGMGRIVCFYVDPNNTQRLYLGSRTGGFWSSNDGGTTWSGGSTDFLAACGVNTISASPTNSDSVLINVNSSSNHTTHGIYRSINGGNDWTQTDFNPDILGWGGLGTNSRIYKIEYHPTVPDLVFIGTNSGLYRSDDNLTSWNTPVVNQRFGEISFHPTDPSIVYAFASSNSDDMYISTDTGATFTLTPIPNASGGGRIAISEDCEDCVFYMSGSGIWKSTDKGSSFTQVSTPGLSSAGFAVSDVDTSKMIAGYLDAFASADGGANFNQVTYWSLGNTNGSGSGFQYSFDTSTDYIHADLQDADCVNGIFYAVTDGFLVSSADNGASWNILSKDIAIRMNYNLGVSQSNHSRTICGSQDNGTSINTENGWVEMYGADGMEGFIHPLNDDWMIGSLQNGGRIKTFNAGQSNSTFTAGGEGGSWIAPMFYDPNNSMQVYSMSTNVFRSTDFGGSWTNVGTPSFSGSISRGTIAENNSGIMIATNGASIELSVDSGTTWLSIQNGLPSSSITDVVFDPNNDSTLIATYARYQNDNSKVFISHDLGTTWTNITYNLGNIPVRSAVIDHSNSSIIYVGTEIGLYKKAMSDVTWTLYNPDLPNVSINELEIMWGSNTLRASTWGRGLWEYDLDGRSDYPKITKTKTTDLPTFETPKATISQFVTSTISYSGTLSSVYIDWSVNTPSFGSNTIPMSNVGGNEWKSDMPLPDYSEGTSVYFKVFAVGNSGDTTETYKYMYTLKPFEFCSAAGSGDYNLHVTNVNVANINHITANDTFAYFGNEVVQLMVNDTFTVSVSGSNGWGANDYAVWIDYNKNAVFDTEEAILYALDAGSSAIDTFVVPTTAFIGDTLKMRVRMGYWYSSSINPCGTALGEVEDYPVIITGSCLPTSSTDVQTACESYTWIDGIAYTSSNTTATHTLINAQGCDSVITLDLTIDNPSTSTDVQTACSSYTWIDGITYTSSNSTATYTLTDAQGCDSVITLGLTIHNPSISTDVQTACSSYTWIDGITYTSSNSTATYTLTDAQGCDSVITLDLTIDNPSTSTDVQTACESYTWIDGITYTSSNSTATYTLTNAQGCDSVITLDLTIHNPSTSTDVQTACSSYTWIDGITYTSSNSSATHTLVNAVGCDSVITLDLTIDNPSSSTDVQTACSSYTWIDGITYTSSNSTATHTLTDAQGCDSVITLDLTIHNPSSSTDVQTACESYTWIDGITYTSSNSTATHTLVNAVGCDSVISLDLTIQNPSSSTDVQTACSSYTWIDGITYTSSNSTATHTLTDAQGCDSVITLDLTIHNPSISTDVQTACESYTWINGIAYTSSNTTATHTLVNAVGCDSVISLDLTIHNPSSSTDVQTACSSYTWINGIAYTSSNTTATHMLTDAQGCDSVITLDLTIHNPSTSTDVQTACESYTWIDGITYMSSNTIATHTLVNVVGCDSVVTLDLTITALDVSVSINGIILTANSTVGTYQWIDCSDNIEISGAVNQEFIPAVNGMYAVIVSDGICSDTSECLSVITIGTEDINKPKHTVVIYPNPSYDGFFTLLYSGEIENVEVFDLTGRLIKTPSYINKEIDCSNLQSGKYIIRIKTPDKYVFEEIIVIE